jgi:hypothetical protein
MSEHDSTLARLSLSAAAVARPKIERSMALGNDAAQSQRFVSLCNR